MYVVMRTDDAGRLVASANPHVHNSEKQAKDECERLARMHPGTRFIYFKSVATCVDTSITWSRM